MRIRNLIAASGVVLLMLILGCVTEARQAGRGSEVENEVYGEMVDPNGKPVRGAKVKILPMAGALRKANAAAAGADSTVSDSAGRYAFRGLDSGAYALQGDYQSGTLVLLRRGIILADTGTDLDLGADTLRPPGRIRGRMLLGDKGKGAVLCYIPGTSYLAVSDDSGRFAITGVPQGTYAIGYSAPGFLVPADTAVVVVSSRMTELPDKHLEYDPALPPPAPTGLRASYDTLGESVTLAWDAVPVSDLEGFVIYRDEPDFPEPPPLRNGFTSGTSYTDSSVGPLENGARRILTYRIKARDREANVSDRFSAPCRVEAVSRTFLATEGHFTAVGATDGRATPGDSVRFVFAYANPKRSILSVSWYPDTAVIPVRVAARVGKEGADTLIYVPDSPGPKPIRAVLADETGMRWTFGTSLTVVRDPPKAVLRMPGQVFAGSMVRVDWSGSTDSAGIVVKTELRLGVSGSFATVKGQDTLIAIPDSERGDFPIGLRVTDDDGNVSEATALIQVIGKGRWTRSTDSGPPVLADDGQFKAAEFGSKGWILSTSGVFASEDHAIWEQVGALPIGASGVVASVPYRGKIFCLLGTSETAIAVYATANGADWEKISDSLPISQDSIPPSEADLVPFQGKLLLYADWAGTRVKTEIWSTEDGKLWKRESSQPAFIGRLNTHPIEWGNRLWIYGGHTSANIPGAIEDDVWSSADGVVWTKTADSIGGYREWPEILPCGDRLVITGGDDEFFQSHTDIWTSADGVNWIAAPPVSDFIGVSAAVAVGAGDYGYLYGGLNRKLGWQRSVWKCE